MKNISIITVIACSILFSICSVNAAEHSREEYGSKMVKLEWCTEEFHTQAEFHKQISGWKSIDSDGVTLYSYEFIEGGNAWTSAATASPETGSNYFIRTKKVSGESVADIKNRMSSVVKDATGNLPTNDESRWWINGDEVNYLLISM